MKRIFLLGYMGSGKTSMGMKLAENLGLSFIDMDNFIEEKYHKTVAQIFAELGEEEFRRIERQCLHVVSEFENCVVATGGGVPCFFDNMEFMKKSGLAIYINLSADQLAVRLESSKEGKRPLLANRKGEDLRNFIQEGLAKRVKFYNQAQYVVSGSDDEILDKIMAVVENYY